MNYPSTAASKLAKKPNQILRIARTFSSDFITPFLKPTIFYSARTSLSQVFPYSYLTVSLQIVFILITSILISPLASASNKNELSCIDLSTQSNKNTANQPTSKSINICEEALAWRSQIETSRLDEYLTLIKLYDRVGDHDISSELLNKLVADYKTKNLSLPFKLTFSSGVHYYRAKDYQKSLESFLESLEQAEKTKDPQLIARSLNANANLLQVFREYDLMWLLLNRAKEHYKKLNNESMLAVTENNLGNAKYYLEDYQMAALHYKQAIAAYEQQQKRSALAHSLVNLARTHIKLSNYMKSEMLLVRARKLAIDLQLKRLEIEILAHLASIATSNSELDKAEFLVDQANNIDSVTIAESNSIHLLLSTAKLRIKQNQSQLAINLLLNSRAKYVKQGSIDQLIELDQLLAQQLEASGEIDRAAQFWKEISLNQNNRLPPTFLAGIIKRLGSDDPIQNTKIPLITSKTDSHFESPALLIWVGAITFSIGLLTLLLAFYKLKRSAFRVNSDSSQTNQNLQNQKNTINDDSLIESSNGKPVIEQSNFNSLEKRSTTSDFEADENVCQRKLIVELMHLARNIWEQETQTSVIELAESSGIWKVNIDEGRLRARAMERYFDIDKLPKNPRWKNVIKTCNFVINQSENQSVSKAQLIEKLDIYLESIKQKAIAA